TYIANKSTFIAVGALHLPGKDGLINLLREAGYTVEQVE
ncbi:MAG: TraB/GumN family protein, partial [Paludibacteraceae bacterium]|nr:TraB/GumN family protein [Paludibacteraceae bacterium]